jgi:hypothetical protein
MTGVTVEGILEAEAKLRTNAGNNQTTEQEDILAQLKPTTNAILNPGMDYKNDKLWYTFPASRMVMKKKGKGKDAPEVPVQEWHTVCLNSDQDLFLYEENELYKRSFRMPDSFMVSKDGWRSETPYIFAKGKTKTPDSFELYMRVRRVYEQYIEFAEEEMYDIVTSWVMATYVYQVFDQFAYLHFNGTAASGKSQNLRILSAIAFNAQWTTNMTAAALFRGIANNPGVYCIDEAESFRDEKGQELRTILRNGYKKGMDVKRLHGKSDGTFEEHAFNTYGPKALASINALDDTTSQRAIVIGMRPAYRDIPYFDQDHSDWSALRDDLYLWALHNAGDIHTEWMRWNVADRTLINRAWEVSACIVTTAHYIHGATVSDSVVGWLERYFEHMRQQQDANDLIRTLATALPAVMQTIPARDDWWYPLSDIRDKLLDITDEDVSDKITTRSIQRWLKPLGLDAVRKAKGGKQIQLHEPAIRQVIKERRIDPLPEDVAWLAGKKDYQTEDKRTDISVFTWGEDDDTTT